MAQMIEEMTTAEQVAEIHSMLTAVTKAIADAGSNPMMRAMRFPQVSTERFADDDLADSLAMMRQLGVVFEAIGTNPMFSGIAKNFLG